MSTIKGRACASAAAVRAGRNSPVDCVVVLSVTEVAEVVVVGVLVRVTPLIQPNAPLLLLAAVATLH